MGVAARIEGDLRVAGDLFVDKDIPDIPRSSLTQDVLAEFSVPFTECRVHDAITTLLPSAGATDDLGLYGGTFGTNSPKLSTGDLKAAGATTRYARFQVVLPAEYDAAQTLKLRASAGMETTVADNTATVDFEVYKSDREAGVGSDLCTTAAQSCNSLTFADKDFTIDPTGLAAGDVLDVRVALAVNDAATGTVVQATIGEIQLLADIKG